MGYYTFIALSGLSVACFIMAATRFVTAWRAISAEVEDDRNGDTSPIIRILSPIFRAASPYVWRSFGARFGVNISETITKAGLEDVWDAQVFLSAKILMPIILAVILGLLLPWKFTFSSLMGAIFGATYWHVWIRGRVKKRREEIELTLPNALDWLALSVEAGQDFVQALAKVTLALPKSYLKRELVLLNSTVKMGLARREGLMQMSKRCDVPAVSSFCAFLVQADQLGTSIGPVLKFVARRVRTERFARAERRGAAAAQKALMPLALFIMPATFIVVFGPLVVRFLTQGLSGFLGGM